MIPEFTIAVPVVGNRWSVGLAFQIHLVFVAFIMGIAILAPTAELLGLRRGGEHWERLAHELGLTIVRIFSFAATWAVFALVLLFGLYPRLFGVLTGIFFWPLVAVPIIWLAMTLSAYFYYYTWTRLDQHRGAHLAIGWTFAASAFAFITVIVELSSFQLTPTQSTELPAASFNPSWLPEVIHRHVGNLSYAGLLLAGYASVRTLLFRVDEGDRAYYDWLGHVGLLLGVGLALLQPVAGWFYARQVQLASPGAYQRMMIADDAWLFLVQTFFLGATFFMGNVYLTLAIRRGSPGPRTANWLRGSLWAIGLLALLGIVPSGWPLGQMMPWKYVSLAGLVLLSAVNLGLYLRARGSFVWGRAGRGSQMALAALGVTIVALIVTMGIIRESARGRDLIYGVMGPNQAQRLEQP